MPVTSAKPRPKSKTKPVPPQEPAEIAGVPTVVGWQGVCCQLPPEWSVTGFSMSRENGYLRIDAPGDAALTVQIRWMNAAKPQAKTPYYLLAPHFRRWLKRPEPAVPAPDLRINLEKLLKDTAKQSKKAKAAFDSTIKPEKVEGEQDERKSMNFSWSGEGRGQGKTWYCSKCKRLVIAQVVGMAKDNIVIGQVASALLGSLRCHSEDAFDTWALYGLEVGIPADFTLETQRLTSGHLHLAFLRNGERITVDRWALANMTLKKFTLSEWFHLNSVVGTKGMTKETESGIFDFETIRYHGKLTGYNLVKVAREVKMRFRRFATRYDGGIWHQPDANRIVMIQVLHSRKTENLWQEIVKRCVCR